MEDKRCPCGGIILADTEDWQTPLCHECWLPYTRMDVPKLVETMTAIADLGHGDTADATDEDIANIAVAKARLVLDDLGVKE
jgi:hypothetical protein